MVVIKIIIKDENEEILLGIEDEKKVKAIKEKLLNLKNTKELIASIEKLMEEKEIKILIDAGEIVF